MYDAGRVMVILIINNRKTGKISVPTKWVNSSWCVLDQTQSFFQGRRTPVQRAEKQREVRTDNNLPPLTTERSETSAKV